MNLPANHYHLFLGNGLDAVLIGPTGAMVPTRAQGNLDRCYWYKSNRYYPEGRGAITPGRLPREGQPLYAEGYPWRESAPLGRTWYEVRHGGLRLDVRATNQHFAPEEGTLYSEVDYGSVQAKVVTFLHATRSLLVMRFEFSQRVDFRAYVGAGVWEVEGFEPNPFDEVTYGAGAQAEYRLTDDSVKLSLAIDPPAESTGGSSDRWLGLETTTVTQLFAVQDNQDGPIDEQLLEDALALGYEALREEHQAVWRAYAARSRIEIPDALYQQVYDFGVYQFKASQNPRSGGLPVNNLRLTWSSHIFWDAYFIHQALIDANHVHEAQEGARFFLRTVEQARRHAQEDFNAPGLKWDWEITHDGERAYGTWVHQKEQMHNNASYANIIWNSYEFTGDREYLAEFYPLLRGIAEFFLDNVVEVTERGYEVRPLVDVVERVTPVRNEGLNLSGTIRVLQLAARAASELGADSKFAARCAEVAGALMYTLDRFVFNGRYFGAAEGDDSLTLSSLGPIYPMMIIRPDDKRAVATADAFLAATEQFADREGYGSASPWGLGMLATVLAWQGRGDIAWQTIKSSIGGINQFGGVTELVLPGNRWNMQYFGTASAAICIAINSLMLQGFGGEVRIFPAVPSEWPHCSFERLLMSGLEVSGTLNRAEGRANVRVRNITPRQLDTTLRYSDRVEDISLQPGVSLERKWRLT